MNEKVTYSYYNPNPKKDPEYNSSSDYSTVPVTGTVTDTPHTGEKERPSRCWIPLYLIAFVLVMAAVGMGIGGLFLPGIEKTMELNYSTTFYPYGKKCTATCADDISYLSFEEIYYAIHLKMIEEHDSLSNGVESRGQVLDHLFRWNGVPVGYECSDVGGKATYSLVFDENVELYGTYTVECNSPYAMDKVYFHGGGVYSASPLRVKAKGDNKAIESKDQDYYPYIAIPICVIIFSSLTFIMLLAVIIQLSRWSCGHPPPKSCCCNVSVTRQLVAAAIAFQTCLVAAIVGGAFIATYVRFNRSTPYMCNSWTSTANPCDGVKEIKVNGNYGTYYGVLLVVEFVALVLLCVGYHMKIPE